MIQRRVFISSVMGGFSAERTAARRAVETLRHLPVMAEDFGATATSPQVACLEGVRQSDIYVGVFGERYGTRVASGLSPTEEEFREAERRGLDMLCFVVKGPRDSDQCQFIDSIKDYEHGKMLAFYESADELKDLITRALNDLAVASTGGGLDASLAQQRFEGRLQSSERYGHGDPELRLAIIPERQVDEYFSPHDLGNEALRETLEQQLFYGAKPRLFDRGLGLHHEDGEDFVRLWQGRDENSAIISVVLYSDATITLACSLKAPQLHGAYSIVRGYVVDELIVLNRLIGFLAFCESVYSSTASCRQASVFFAWMQLASMKDRELGRIPTPEPNSIEMAGHSLDDPVCIPQEPQRIVRKQLLDPDSLANDFLARTIRKFRAARAYYGGR